MDKEQMSELMQPIAELSSAMAGLQVPDSVAEATLAEVLAGGVEEDEAEAEREARERRTAARGKALEALRHAQLASKLDTQGNTRAAINYYERALDDFAHALDGEAVPESAKAKTVASMASYMDRCSVLRVSLVSPDLANDKPKSSQEVLTSMAASGYAVLARGVALRKRAITETRDWGKFVYFSNAADCFLAYLKASEHPPDSVTKVVVATLADLEALAVKLRR